MVMKNILRALVLLLTLSMGSHSLAMFAMTDMGTGDMAMAQSDQSMPSDCATLCLTNAHQLIAPSAPLPTQFSLIAVVALVLFVGYILLDIKQIFPDITYRTKPPDLVNLYAVYRI